MSLRDEARRVIQRIVDDTILSGNLLQCAFCQGDLIDVNENLFLTHASGLGLWILADTDPQADLQHMQCQTCSLVWQYLTSLTNQAGQDIITQRLRVFDYGDELRPVKTWLKMSSLAKPTPKKSPPATGTATTATVSDDHWQTSLLDFGGDDLPDEFRNCGSTGRCFSTYQARCYLVYPSLREANPHFVGHVGECSYCLDLMVTVKNNPESHCPPVNVLLRCKAKQLPDPVQALVWHHVWNRQIHLPGCDCQEIWQSLRPRATP